MSQLAAESWVFPLPAGVGLVEQVIARCCTVPLEFAPLLLGLLRGVAVASKGRASVVPVAFNVAGSPVGIVGSLSIALIFILTEHRRHAPGFVGEPAGESDCRFNAGRVDGIVRGQRRIGGGAADAMQYQRQSWGVLFQLRPCRRQVAG